MLVVIYQQTFEPENARENFAYYLQTDANVEEMAYLFFNDLRIQPFSMDGSQGFLKCSNPPVAVVVEDDGEESEYRWPMATAVDFVKLGPDGTWQRPDFDMRGLEWAHDLDFKTFADEYNRVFSPFELLQKVSENIAHRRDKLSTHVESDPKEEMFFHVSGRAKTWGQRKTPDQLKDQLYTWLRSATVPKGYNWNSGEIRVKTLREGLQSLKVFASRTGEKVFASRSACDDQRRVESYKPVFQDYVCRQIVAYKVGSDETEIQVTTVDALKQAAQGHQVTLIFDDITLAEKILQLEDNFCYSDVKPDVETFNPVLEITPTGVVTQGFTGGVDHQGRKVIAATRASDEATWDKKSNLLDFCANTVDSTDTAATGCKSLTTAVTDSRGQPSQQLHKLGNKASIGDIFTVLRNLNKSTSPRHGSKKTEDRNFIRAKQLLQCRLVFEWEHEEKRSAFVDKLMKLIFVATSSMEFKIFMFFFLKTIKIISNLIFERN